MIFIQKRTIKRRATRRQTEKPDILETLLAEFKAAPVPASQTDWQDLQRRIELRKMAQTPRRSATRTRTKIALAACAVAALIAVGRSGLFSARNAPARDFTIISSLSAPPSGDFTRQTSPAPPKTVNLTPQNCPTPPETSPVKRFATEFKQKNPSSELSVAQYKTGKRQRRFAAARSVRQFVSRIVKAKTPLTPALTPKALNPEITRIAQNVDGENMAFSLVPTDYVLPTVQTAPEPQSLPLYVTVYVTAEIPAPTAWAAQPEPKELKAW